MSSSSLPDPAVPEPSSGSSLEHLHKMSRTAGLGSTDYVAVNTTAVITFILGIASGLSLLGTIMLVVPAATLIIGVMAIIQIRRSAGTQSGMLIASLGILLALVFVAAVGGKEIIREHRDYTEQEQIKAVINKLGQAVSSKDYTTAWSCFSPRFQEKTTQANFTDLWSRAQASPYFGEVKGMTWNGILDIEEDEATNGGLSARGFVLIYLTKNTSERREAGFRKDPDIGWTFEDLQGFAPPPLAGKSATPAAK